MAVNSFGKVDTTINSPRVSNPYTEALAKLISSSNAGEQVVKGYQNTQDTKLKALLQGQQATADREANIKDLDTLHGANPNAFVKAGDLSISPKDDSLALERLLLSKERFAETKKKTFDAESEKLSGIYGKNAEYGNLGAELEASSNVDGKGGIFTNPDAKLRSEGKILNRLGSSILGAASMLPSITGVTPEMVAERKLVDRYRNEYMKATSGMRVTDAAAKREQEAMGMLSSGDPQLLSKGLRSLNEAYQERLRVSSTGFNQDVKDNVHRNIGYDPGNRFKLQAPAPKSNLTPEEQKELEELRAEQAAKSGK